MLKDLRLASEAAESVDAYTPMGWSAEDLYARFEKLGFGHKDFSGIIQMIENGWDSILDEEELGEEEGE